MPAKITLLLAWLASALPASADPQDAPQDTVILSGYVANLCRATDRTAKLACTTYLRGMVDGLVAAGRMADDDYPPFCPPSDGMGPDELKQIFLEAVRVEPDARTEEAGSLLLFALEDHFPCDDGSDPVTATEQAAYRPGRQPILRSAGREQQMM